MAWTSAAKVQQAASGRSVPVLWSGLHLLSVFADWYPTFTEATQEGSNITVTFNLAPAHLGISSYFLQCYGNGMKTYAEITPVTSALLMGDVPRSQD